jgi:hypothetical protein
MQSVTLLDQKADTVGLGKLDFELDCHSIRAEVGRLEVEQLELFFGLSILGITPAEIEELQVVFFEPLHVDGRCEFQRALALLVNRDNRVVDLRGLGLADIVRFRGILS